MYIISASICTVHGRPFVHCLERPSFAFGIDPGGRISRTLLEAGIQGGRTWKHGLHPEVETGHEFSGFHTEPGNPMERLPAMNFYVSSAAQGHICRNLGL